MKSAFLFLLVVLFPTFASATTGGQLLEECRAWIFLKDGANTKAKASDVLGSKALSCKRFWDGVYFGVAMAEAATGVNPSCFGDSENVDLVIMDYIKFMDTEDSKLREADAGYTLGTFFKKSGRCQMILLR